MKRAGTASVGIMYLVGNKLHIDATPVAQASRHAHFVIHEDDHITYWAKLVRVGAVRESPYEEYPRGRVAYNTRTSKFSLLADRCILRRKGVVKAILRQMHLPSKGTEIRTDSHYRCFKCLEPESSRVLIGSRS